MWIGGADMAFSMVTCLSIADMAHLVGVANGLVVQTAKNPARIFRELMDVN